MREEPNEIRLFFCECVRCGWYSEPRDTVEMVEGFEVCEECGSGEIEYNSDYFED